MRLQLEWQLQARLRQPLVKPPQPVHWMREQWAGPQQQELLLWRAL